MSYMCTKCGYRHHRGAIFVAHDKYKYVMPNVRDMEPMPVHQIGHVVHGEKVAPKKQKIEVVRKWRRPKAKVKRQSWFRRKLGEKR